jgi:hypothetical protein
MRHWLLNMAVLDSHEPAGHCSSHAEAGLLVICPVLNAFPNGILIDL